MKLVFILVLFSVVFFFSVYQIAYAHFPATDGDMTVTLHVDPNDDPTPLQQANLYFLFDDSGRHFSVTQCNCTVTVSEQGRPIFQQQLTANNAKQPSIWGARMPFIFPRNDIYQIILTGKPKNNGTFQSFYLSWYFRVDPATPGLVVQQRPSELPYLLGGAGVVIIFFILFGWFIKTQISDTEKKGAKHTRRQHKK